MTKKPIGPTHKFGEKRDRDARRWARNGETAVYLNVSKMTLWRWKHEEGYNFPAAAKIDSMEFNDLDKVDEWMTARIADRKSAQ